MIPHTPQQITVIRKARYAARAADHNCTIFVDEDGRRYYFRLAIDGDQNSSDYVCTITPADAELAPRQIAARLSKHRLPSTNNERSNNG